MSTPRQQPGDTRPVERDCICVPRQLGDGHTPECHAAFGEKIWIAVAAAKASVER